MCRSVPQIPACVTATRTSRGPIAGIGISEEKVSPGPATVFFSPRIVVLVDFVAVFDFKVAVAMELFSYLSNSDSCILDRRLQFARRNFQYNGRATGATNFGKDETET